MTNNLITRYDARDYIKGDGHIVLSGVGINDWTPYFHFKELQKIGGFESDDCVIFSASEITDAEIDYLISVGKISQTTIDWFTSLGFMDSVNSDDGKSHFHSSPRYWGTLTGNGQNGNALQDPWNVGRKYGAIPWTDLPFDATITTPEQYFAPIPQNLLDKGQQFLMGVGGKNWIQFHWLYNDTNGTISFPSLDADRFATPLQIGVNVGNDWNEVSPPAPPMGSPAGHSVTNIASSAQGEVIFDHYVPYVKTLGAGYPIPQVMQAVITITPPPPAPPAPVITNDTPAQAQQATSNWLQAIVKWLSGIIGNLSGAKVGSNNTTMNKLKAYDFGPVKLALLDVAIKVGVFAGLLILNLLSAALSNGSIQLPYPAVLLPILTILVSQLDAKFVQYAQDNDVPLPPPAPTA